VLGFALDLMTLRDLKTLAGQIDVFCADKRMGLLEWVEAPLAALGSKGPSISKLNFGFSPATQLVNITAWHDGLSGEVAATQTRAGLSYCAARRIVRTASVALRLRALQRDSGSTVRRCI
jgi:hypothetical protein